jgi:hypothetical protein
VMESITRWIGIESSSESAVDMVGGGEAGDSDGGGGKTECSAGEVDGIVGDTGAWVESRYDNDPLTPRYSKMLC